MTHIKVPMLFDHLSEELQSVMLEFWGLPKLPRVGDFLDLASQLGDSESSPAIADNACLRPEMFNDHVKICLLLGAAGKGFTKSNPMVGAVLVWQGRIIGIGAHLKCGEKHAEVNAVENAIKNGFGDKLVDSTMVVTLEPCSHIGKTPPCSAFIVKHGIKSLVYGSRDPDARVQGNGLEYLKANGVKVYHDKQLGAANEWLNRIYFNSRLGKGSYVSLKMATTLDGVIAYAGDSRAFLSSARSRLLARWMRAAYDWIAVGPDTMILDNPLLNLRDVFTVSAASPGAIVFDPKAKAMRYCVENKIKPKVICSEFRVSNSVSNSASKSVIWAVDTVSKELISLGRSIGLEPAGPEDKIAGKMVLASFDTFNTWFGSELSGNSFFIEGGRYAYQLFQSQGGVFKSYADIIQFAVPQIASQPNALKFSDFYHNGNTEEQYRDRQRLAFSCQLGDEILNFWKPFQV